MLEKYLPCSWSGRLLWVLMLLLAAGPPVTALTGGSFYLDLLTRIMVLSMAAVSLNLIVGYGGMVSLGQAAFIGIGAYCVGIPSYYGIHDGFVHLGLAIASSAVFALVTGAVILRTRGIYFIMITLAFAQMLYYTFVSLDPYGGDDGMVIELRSRFPGFLDLDHNLVLYYLIFAALVVTLIFVHRLVGSRFGRVMIGSMHNDERMRSLGFETYRYRLTCYVLSGVICGIAGFLLANFNSYISPEMMNWTRSAELLLILILGGVGSPLGPVVGAFIFVLLEHWLSGITMYWELIFGSLLVAVVLVGRGGIAGFLARIR